MTISNYSQWWSTFLINVCLLASATVYFVHNPFPIWDRYPWHGLGVCSVHVLCCVIWRRFDAQIRKGLCTKYVVALANKHILGKHVIHSIEWKNTREQFFRWHLFHFSSYRTCNQEQSCHRLRHCWSYRLT